MTTLLFFWTSRLSLQQINRKGKSDLSKKTNPKPPAKRSFSNSLQKTSCQHRAIKYMVHAVTLLSQTHCHNLSCLANSAVRSDKLCDSGNFCQETSKGTLIKGILMPNRRYVLLLLIYGLSQNPQSSHPFTHFFNLASCF